MTAGKEAATSHDGHRRGGDAGRDKTATREDATAQPEAAAWAASGAMFLTGRPDGPPLGAPDGFVERLRTVGAALARSSRQLGRPVEVDALALLGERAALAGLRRGGDVSCGGSARLLRTADGWLAVSLPRPDDLDLLPAWLVAQGFGAGEDPWAAVAAAVADGEAGPLAERAQLLGLPVAALPRQPPAVPLLRPPDLGAEASHRRVAGGPFAGLPVVATGVDDVAGAGPLAPLDGLLVADLSSLWAGPLCTHLLQQGGARVVKVESVHRPDGARSGPAAFFDLLHGGQEAVAIDFRDEQGRAALRELLAVADVVVEASRPRALEHLGLGAEEFLTGVAGAGAGPRVWVSITGYGRATPGRDWVAFGDDAAVAGGLVAWDDAGPCFLADAVADPCAGLVAAAAVLRALCAGGRWLLDVSMRDVAAHLAGPQHGPGAVAMPSGIVPAPPRPRARATSARGPRLGEHTEAVLAEVRQG
jgi:hypothetical protein